jgi:hypothetical protein
VSGREAKEQIVAIKKDSAPSIIYGLDENGNPVHIDSAENGRKCGLVCKECRGELSAKQGKVNSHHFSHVVAQTSRQAARCNETALHLAAKIQVLKMQSLFIPNGCNGKTYYEFNDSIVSKEGVGAKFSAKILGGVNEYVVSGGEMVYDCLLRIELDSDCVHELVVEVFVTHEVDEQKTSKIKKLGISCLQLNMSDMRRMPHYNQDDLVKHILDINHVKVINISKALREDLRRLSGVGGMVPYESKYCLKLYEDYINSKIAGREIIVFHFDGQSQHKGRTGKKLPMRVLSCFVFDSGKSIELKLEGGKTLTVAIVRNIPYRWGWKVEGVREIYIASKNLVEPSLFSYQYSKDIVTVNTGRFTTGHHTMPMSSYRENQTQDKNRLHDAQDVVSFYKNESKKIINDEVSQGNHQGIFNFNYHQEFEKSTPGLHKRTDDYILENLSHTNGLDVVCLSSFLMREFGEARATLAEIKSKLSNAEVVISSLADDYAKKHFALNSIYETREIFESNSVESWVDAITHFINQSESWRVLRGGHIEISVFSKFTSQSDASMALEIIKFCDMNPFKDWSTFHNCYLHRNNEQLKVYTDKSSSDISRDILSCILDLNHITIESVEGRISQSLEFPDFSKHISSYRKVNFENEAIAGAMHKKLEYFEGTQYIRKFIGSIVCELAAKKLLSRKGDSYTADKDGVSDYMHSFAPTRSNQAKASVNTPDLYEESWGWSDTRSRELKWE